MREPIYSLEKSFFLSYCSRKFAPKTTDFLSRRENLFCLVTNGKYEYQETSGEVPGLVIEFTVVYSIQHVLCRLQREEAKISAWESLQKAKAEAEIRKLEVNSLLAIQVKYHHSCFWTFCSCNTCKKCWDALKDPFSVLI